MSFVKASLSLLSKTCQTTCVVLPDTSCLVLPDETFLVLPDMMCLVLQDKTFPLGGARGGGGGSFGVALTCPRGQGLSEG